MNNVWNDCPICQNPLYYKKHYNEFVIQCESGTMKEPKHLYYIDISSSHKILNEQIWLYTNVDLPEFKFHRTKKKCILIICDSEGQLTDKEINLPIDINIYKLLSKDFRMTVNLLC